jgi:hypothetical protein
VGARPRRLLDAVLQFLAIAADAATTTRCWNVTVAADAIVLRLRRGRCILSGSVSKPGLSSLKEERT